MARQKKADPSIEINVGGVKNVGEFNVAGQYIKKNAPEKQSTRAPKGSTKIDVKNIEGVSKANVAGIEIIEYRENDFKAALDALQNVITNSSLNKEQKIEFRELAHQLEQSKPGVDLGWLRTIWGRIIQFVKLAGLSSSVRESLLNHSWKVVSGYLGIG